MDNGGTILLVVFFGDPHGGKSRKMGQNGSSDPDRVFSLLWGVDFDLHFGGSEVDHLFLKSLWDTWVHSSTTRHDHVFIKVSSDIDITFKDRIVSQLVNGRDFSTDTVQWVEKSLWALELRSLDGDGLTIWELVSFMFSRGIFKFLHLFLVVQSNVAQFFLDVSDNFHFSG